MAGRPDDDTLKRGLDRARKKVGADKPARPRAKARAAKAAPADEAPAEGGDATGKTAAPAGRQRRPSRLPTSSSSCIASARSPSIFSRPSSSVCIGAIVPARTPSNVAAVDAQGRARAARADARLAETDVHRPAPPPPPLDLERRAAPRSAHQIDVARLGEQEVARRRVRRAAATGRSAIGRAQRDAQVGDRLADPDVGRLPSRGGATDSVVSSARTLPRPAPRARDADADRRRAGGRALARRREGFGQPAFEQFRDRDVGRRPIPVLHRRFVTILRRDDDQLEASRLPRARASGAGCVASRCGAAARRRGRPRPARAQVSDPGDASDARAR